MGQNTKVVQQAYDAFGRGDIPGLLALLDDSVEWSSPKTLPHGGDFRGRLQGQAERRHNCQRLDRSG